MGVSGSGQWCRWDSKTTTESQCKIDIRWMRKKRCLRPGTEGTLSWTKQSGQSDSIHYRVKSDGLVLNYRNSTRGGEGQDIKDEILFDWTPCNYGGKRQWFLCPLCNRRIAVLYGGKYFRCRHCHNLTYACQQENQPLRLMRKTGNIRTRLGGSLNLTEPFPDKPLNMHWKTYRQLQNEAEGAYNRAWMIVEDRYKIDVSHYM